MTGYKQIYYKFFITSQPQELICCMELLKKEIAVLVIHVFITEPLR
jgi:hypothetical protein